MTTAIAPTTVPTPPSIKLRAVDFPRARAIIPVRILTAVPGFSTTISADPVRQQLPIRLLGQPWAARVVTLSMGTTFAGKPWRAVEFNVTVKGSGGFAEQKHKLRDQAGTAELPLSVDQPGRFRAEVEAGPQIALPINYGASTAEFEVLYPEPGIWDWGWIINGRRTPPSDPVRAEAKVGDQFQYFVVMSFPQAGEGLLLLSHQYVQKGGQRDEMVQKVSWAGEAGEPWEGISSKGEISSYLASYWAGLYMSIVQQQGDFSRHAGMFLLW